MRSRSMPFARQPAVAVAADEYIIVSVRGLRALIARSSADSPPVMRSAIAAFGRDAPNGP